jgi:hypothetical protein
VIKLPGQSNQSGALNDPKKPCSKKNLEHMVERAIVTFQAALSETERLRLELEALFALVDRLRVLESPPASSDQAQGELEKSVRMAINNEELLRHMKGVLERNLIVAKDLHNGKIDYLQADRQGESLSQNAVVARLDGFSSTISALRKLRAELRTIPTPLEMEGYVYIKTLDVSDEEWESMNKAAIL